MRKVLAALGVAAAILAPVSAAEPMKYAALFDALWHQVDTSFYDPHFHGVDWAAAGARYRAKLGDVKTDADFAALAGAMLDELHASHTFVSPPSPIRVGVGVRLRELDGRYVVTQVWPLSDAWRLDIRPGDSLSPPATPDDLRGAPGTAASFRIDRCETGIANVTVRRAPSFFPPEEPGFRWSAVQVDGKTRLGLITADRFDDGAAELADRAMADLKDTQGLIIDIRGNTGGNASALRLASYFGAGAAPAIILLSRPYLEKLGHPPTPAEIAAAPRVQGAYTDAAVFQAVGEKGGGAAFWTQDVGEKRYRGPVVVLTGEDTGSAAEGFAWFMRLKTQARFIGEKTAGAFLGGQTFDLPDGWHVTLPVYGLWGPEGGDYGDKPVTPDAVVVPKAADLCRGRDRAMEAAMAWLAKPSP